MIRRPLDVVRRGGVYASVVATVVMIVFQIVSAIFVFPGLVGLITFGIALFCGGAVGLGTGYHKLQQNRSNSANNTQTVQSDPPKQKRRARSVTQIINGAKQTPQALVAAAQAEARKGVRTSHSANSAGFFGNHLFLDPTLPKTEEAIRKQEKYLSSSAPNLN